MLFLGAGASKPFGIPTMKEFTEEIPKALRDDEAKEINDILLRLKGHGYPEADMESVMNVLPVREDLTRARRSIGPRLFEFAEGIQTKPFSVRTNILLEDTKKEIETRCLK